ncbi:MAG: N-glycosylase/DNA lyase, partial [Thermoplasmata archaeon]
ILDRHIMRNLIRHGVIASMPRSLTPKRYLAIEDVMDRFADDIGIPMAAIDLLLWSRETGEIFK